MANAGAINCSPAIANGPQIPKLDHYNPLP